MIAVFGRQRSGTTVFRKLLASSMLIYDAGEVFHSQYKNNKLNFFNFVETALSADRMSLPEIFTHKAIVKFLQYVAAMQGKAQPMIDVKYNSNFDLFLTERLSGRAPTPPLLQALRMMQARIFHIVRRNKLRLLVSERIAIATNQWGVMDPDRRRQASIELNPRVIHELIEEECLLSARVERLIHDSGDGLTVFYEDMFDASGRFAPALLAEVQDMLGPDTGLNAAPGLIRQNPEPLTELIRNHPAVAAALRATPHAWMLED